MKLIFLFFNIAIYGLIYHIGNNIFPFIETGKYDFAFLFGFLALFLLDIIVIDIYNAYFGGENEEEEGNDR